MSFLPGPALTLDHPLLAGIVARGIELAIAERRRNGQAMPSGEVLVALRRAQLYGQAADRQLEVEPQTSGLQTSTSANDIGVTKAAGRLGLSTERVRQLHDEGTLAGWRDSRDFRRFRLEDVEALAARRAKGATRG